METEIFSKTPIDIFKSKSISKFLIADNPMVERQHSVVLCARPFALIECIPDYPDCPEVNEQFTFLSRHGDRQDWTLRIHSIVLEEPDLEKRQLKISNLLRRACRWYRALLDWEKSNQNNY